MYSLFLIPKLPLVNELANLLVTWVFRYYGIPNDMVSDHGPQFTQVTSQIF